jgi:AraC-like DNA-binding protein
MTCTRSEKSVFPEKLTGITGADLENEHSGDSELDRVMGMSRSNLHRKVRVIKDTSASLFIRQVRLRKAMGLLQQNSSTISEVAFEWSFHSVSYFSRCFSNHFSYPPGKAGKSDADELNSDGFQHHDTKPGISERQLTTIIPVSILFVIIVL